MKLEKNKHDHKLTQWLKVGIFALLMLAPLFASLTQTLYVTLNKNAKDSYYGETINERIDIKVDYTNLQGNETYYFKNPLTDEKTNQYGTQTKIYVTNCVNLNGFNNNADLSEVTYLQLYLTNNYNALEFYTPKGKLFGPNLYANLIEFSFTYMGATGNLNAINYYNYFFKITYNKYSYLDNAFYYGVDQMTKSDLFNWTENTALYTGIKAMTDNLQVETNAIAILLTYWMILTIIYIIIDIVTNMFTFLTHMIVRSE